MVRISFIRTASAAGALLLALFILGSNPILAVAPSAGAWFGGFKSPVPVDRTLKGDRLASTDFATQPEQSWRPDFDYEFGVFKISAPAQSPRVQMPVGCDPSFSPIYSSPSNPNVYRRCTV